ncbi:hypothetical protein [Frankia sp. QA3]|uniref:hypothetical protein n=1 Tax=Frankia sp. QA3 TaxID=710111 RepID=UPI0002D877FA|nr:hypothetical protein [Frankia sp. QA3]
MTPAPLRPDPRASSGAGDPSCPARAFRAGHLDVTVDLPAGVTAWLLSYADEVLGAAGAPLISGFPSGHPLTDQ